MVRKTKYRELPRVAAGLENAAPTHARISGYGGWGLSLSLHRAGVNA